MSKSIWIAFRNGGIIPAAVAGGKEKKVGPHEPVEVPESYGQHLIDDRFAYKAEKPAATKPAKDQVGRGARQDAGKAARAAELTGTIDDLKKAVEAASDLEAKTKLSAELAAAEDELAEIGAG
ncbi:hypothetical protein P9272_18500 [Mesorhizobium sp. WSM4976]|uniref:hypothetical protein n=1 Tax=Mesorhizobium sp. WSM4976 TaxID=3038549 RepID=UPI00241797CC|nr:hypothetical protein [Mesorhizobium sp. WSM4976]MDG4895564.1 hypothetical protein [Mesorhizobium sp. WSM4976]